MPDSGIRHHAEKRRARKTTKTGNSIIIIITFITTYAGLDAYSQISQPVFRTSVSYLTTKLKFLILFANSSTSYTINPALLKSISPAAPPKNYSLPLVKS